MNDTHKLYIKYNCNDDVQITVNGDAYSVIKKFEAKKMSGSPFVVHDSSDVMWAFDVELINYINIDNTGYSTYAVEADDKE